MLKIRITPDTDDAAVRRHPQHIHTDDNCSRQAYTTAAEDDFTCDMYITEVRLGLMRVTEQDIGTRGLLISGMGFLRLI